MNAICRTKNHQALCSCPRGLEGNPIDRCEPRRASCSATRRCPKGEQCVGGICAAGCRRESDCLPDEVCREGACHRICNSAQQCKGPGQACIDRVCREGCTSDAGCGDDQVCDKGRCRNPCELGDPCGDCAECRTVGHQVQCSCSAGSRGDPLVACRRNYLRCSGRCRGQGETCHSGHCLKKCKSQSDCSCGEACKGELCLQKCSRSQDCQNGVRCVGGTCSPGCRSSLDCSTRESCVAGQCVDPCENTDCGAHSQCQVSQHQAVCLCVKGFQRDAIRGCRRADCFSDGQCNHDKKCVNARCVNPCLVGNPCGRNAECKVTNHEMLCVCPPGYFGNPRRKLFLFFTTFSK